MNVKQAIETVGSLSEPSKMPGYAYGIPAQDCILGQVLRKRPGSVCHKCYALKGMYSFPVVKNAQRKRLTSLQNNLPAWTEAMTFLIGYKLAKREKVFRWHDSGDIQSMEHLSAIVQIAKNLPEVRFWLPTRERAMVREWLRQNGSFPDNLTVRVSATMIGQDAAPVPGTVASTVGAGIGYACPAYSQGGRCGDCRACWDKNVISVDYRQH